MNIDLEDSSQGLVGALWPLLISLIDDAVVLGLARLGMHLPWLHWLSWGIIAGTVWMWGSRLLRNKRSHPNVAQPLQSKPEPGQ